LGRLTFIAYSLAITAGCCQQQSGIFITETETEALPLGQLTPDQQQVASLASIQLQLQFIQLLL